MSEKPITLLAIESSCDDTSAAVMINRKVHSNVVADQSIHEKYGGVVPELASRAHQANIVPVVDAALCQANIGITDVDAIAYTQGPGLMGSLLVGSSFAKSLALAGRCPLIPVHHMQAHIMAHFIDDPEMTTPEGPFLCLTVSGGHTQIVLVNGPLEFELLGETIDDAAGEAFDKAAKILELPYPGGPLIDRYAAEGNADFLPFAKPKIEGLDFSFSGLKTSILYTLRDAEKKEPGFRQKHMKDICASIQKSIVDILIEKVRKAVKQTGLRQVAIAGGVSANSGLRQALNQAAGEENWKVFIPSFQYCTDNAGMIAIVGHYAFEKGSFGSLNERSQARMNLACTWSKSLKTSTQKASIRKLDL